MLRSTTRAATRVRDSCRSIGHASTRGLKVAVLGSTGGIGQPLALLCKLSPLIDEVSCYDVVGTPGVAADLSHCPTPAKVTGNLPATGTWPPTGNTGLQAALTGADVVIIPAGVPRKPGMTRDDLFNTNAGIVKTLIEGVAEHCPKAIIGVISNPVNSTVPIAAEVLKKWGVYDPKKLCGVTTLDVCRANTFVSANQGMDVSKMNVPVIGGHAGITILPLLSQVPGVSFSDADRDALTVRIQFGGDEVVAAKAGAGSATLSMAYAGFLFTEGVIKAIKGEDITMCAYVENNLTEAQYFATPCKFGPGGVKEVLPYGPLSPYEQAWFDKMIPELKGQIQKGIDFATQ